MFHFDAFLETLPVSGKGILGVFIVMAAIYLCVWALNRIFKIKDQNKQAE